MDVIDEGKANRHVAVTSQYSYYCYYYSLLLLETLRTNTATYRNYMLCVQYDSMIVLLQQYCSPTTVTTTVTPVITVTGETNLTFTCFLWPHPQDKLHTLRCAAVLIDESSGSLLVSGL